MKPAKHTEEWAALCVAACQGMDAEGLERMAKSRRHRRDGIVREWETEAGFPAMIVKTEMGHLCGYVGVNRDHPLYGLGYGAKTAYLSDSVDEPMGKRGIMTLFCASIKSMNTPEIAFDVHGSLTFADHQWQCSDENRAHWWFGFDCAHLGDNPAKCNKNYVSAECESLAQQIKDKTVDPSAELDRLRKVEQAAIDALGFLRAARGFWGHETPIHAGSYLLDDETASSSAQRIAKALRAALEG